MTNLWAVAACHRPDLAKMRASLTALGFEQSRVGVVSNGLDAPTQMELPEATVLPYTSSEYNMPKWWNVGLDWASAQAQGQPYEVFIFNADTVADKNTVTRLAEVLREKDLAATGPDRCNSLPKGFTLVETRLNPLDNLVFRMTGFAFVLKGELELRADPKFRHWYLDDDIEWQARCQGGVGMVGGCYVDHPPYGNPLSPELSQWATEDREKFKIKWGKYPH